MKNLNENTEVEKPTEAASPVDVVVMPIIELMGEYHEDCHTLLGVINQQAKDVESLLSFIDFDGLSVINICTNHGGVGFMSDCVVCKKISGIRKRYEA